MRQILLKNKKIFETKLTITTNCILRCDYCFVKKPKKLEIMDYKTAKAAIDFFLKFGKKDKILKIYGGEPLLNFGLLKKIIPYTIKNIPLNNGLTLSLCTNAVLLRPEHIDFFKKHKFQLAISFDGKKITHDKFRKFRDGKGSFDTVVKNLAFLFQNFKKQDVAANVGIVPSEVGRLFDNYKYIISLGFDTVNLEPIYGFEIWDEKNQKEFGKQIKKIIDFILEGIPKKQFLFLTTINRELKYKTLSRLNKGVCLFDQFLEIYPNGDMGFSSFFFNLPEPQRQRYIVGNVAKQEIRAKYISCRYSKKKCQNCWANYFNIFDKSQGSEIVRKRNFLSIQYADYFKEMAKNNPLFKEYINKAKQHICF